MYRCQFCNISTESFFCPNCGLILRYPQSIEGDKTQKERLQSYIRHIVRKASESKSNFAGCSDKEFLSNAAWRRFGEHISFLQERYSGSAAINNEEAQYIIKLLREFADKCKTNEYHIAIAGKIGAGKSTLVSALLGNGINWTHLNPETNVLTKYRYSEKGNYIKLSYYKTHEWDALWQSAVRASQGSIRNDQEDYLSEFNKFTTNWLRDRLLDREDEVLVPSDEEELKALFDKHLSRESPYHFFVKEAEIGLTAYSMLKKVVIVNTLGMDDPVPYRAEFSNGYLVKSDLIMLCIKADEGRLSQHELKDYANLFSLVKDKEQIHILGTKFDIPKDFDEHWNENTAKEFARHFSAEPYHGSTDRLENRLHYVSAWYYNIIQKAKNEVGFWKDECNVDCLAEVLCRTLGTDIAYRHGTDADSLKECLEKHLYELEYKTNLPNVSNHIILRGIRDIEICSLNDFRNIYMDIRNMAYSAHAPCHSLNEAELATRIAELDSRIASTHNEFDFMTINKQIRALEIESSTCCDTL